MKVTRFRTFDEFFPHYLSEHAHRSTKWIHAVGTFCGTLFLGAAIVFSEPWFILAALGASYGVLTLAHLFIERNVPTSVHHPVWSFFADWKMAYLLVSGKI